VSGFSEVHRSIGQAALNARSLATLKAGTLRILWAKTANLEYEQQCEIEVIYSPKKVEQISAAIYSYIDTSQIK